MEKEELKNSFIEFYTDKYNLQYIKNFDLFIDEIVEDVIDSPNIDLDINLDYGGLQEFVKNNEELVKKHDNILCKYLLEDLFNIKIVKYIYIQFKKLKIVLIENDKFEEVIRLENYYNLITEKIIMELKMVYEKDNESLKNSNSAVEKIFEKIANNEIII